MPDEKRTRDYSRDSTVQSRGEVGGELANEIPAATGDGGRRVDHHDDVVVFVLTSYRAR